MTGMRLTGKKIIISLATAAMITAAAPANAMDGTEPYPEIVMSGEESHPEGIMTDVALGEALFLTEETDSSGEDTEERQSPAEEEPVIGEEPLLDQAAVENGYAPGESEAGTEETGEKKAGGEAGMEETARAETGEEAGRRPGVNEAVRGKAGEEAAVWEIRLREETAAVAAGGDGVVREETTGETVSGEDPAGENFLEEPSEREAGGKDGAKEESSRGDITAEKTAGEEVIREEGDSGRNSGPGDETEEKETREQAAAEALEEEVGEDDPGMESPVPGDVAASPAADGQETEEEPEAEAASPEDGAEKEGGSEEETEEDSEQGTGTAPSGEDGTEPETESGEESLTEADAPVLEGASTFTDVSPNSWYYQTVADISSLGIMTGTSPTTFHPNREITRREFAVLLYRYAGEPAYGQYVSFTDVADGQWYTDAVRWASSVGVILGYADGRFGTRDPASRQQICTILYRYARDKEQIDVSAQGSLSAFPDASSVSDYARDAVRWAVDRGILQGSGGYLRPNRVATRAECAAILLRYLRMEKQPSGEPRSSEEETVTPSGSGQDETSPSVAELSEHDKLEYSFINYTVPYISRDLCTMMYGEGMLAKKAYEINSGAAGVCYGMTATAALLYLDGSGIRPQDFDSTASWTRDLEKEDLSESLGLTVNEFIQAFQVAQIAPYLYNLKAEIRYLPMSQKAPAVIAELQAGRPVILSIRGSEKTGHSVLAYRFEENGDRDRLYVYDPSVPSGDRYLTLIEENGVYTGWSFMFMGKTPWGSMLYDYFSYFTSQNIMTAWRNRGKLAQSRSRIVELENLDFTAFASDGSLAVRVEGGTEQQGDGSFEKILTDGELEALRETPVEYYYWKAEEPVTLQLDGSVPENGFSLSLTEPGRVLQISTTGDRIGLVPDYEGEEGRLAVIVNASSEYQIRTDGAEPGGEYDLDNSASDVAVLFFPVDGAR